jgi:hypothetical protein
MLWELNSYNLYKSNVCFLLVSLFFIHLHAIATVSTKCGVVVEVPPGKAVDTWNLPTVFRTRFSKTISFVGFLFISQEPLVQACWDLLHSIELTERIICFFAIFLSYKGFELTKIIGNVFKNFQNDKDFDYNVSVNFPALLLLYSYIVIKMSGVTFQYYTSYVYVSVLAHTNTGVVSSNLTQGMDVCVQLFCLCCCVCR